MDRRQADAAASWHVLLRDDRDAGRLMVREAPQDRLGLPANLAPARGNMSASPPAPLIWGALLCRLVPEGMVWDARVHQWVPQPEPYNALAVPAGAHWSAKGPFRGI
jgi:hypothetical protein